MADRPARVFRVFVSSTFLDMQVERDALHKRCFDELASYCRQHGAIFQAVDLRWGVSPQAVHEHKVLEICLSEVRRCQQQTARPNFIVLLGERYGSCLLPPRVATEDFTSLCLRTDPADSTLLQHWYRRDDNAVPAEFVLRARAGEFVRDDVWARQESQIQHAWANALGRMDWSADDPRHVHYAGSATAHEVLAGPLSSSDQAAQALAYCKRDDADEQDKRQAGLRQRLRQALAPAHVREYQGGDLDALCERVRHDLQEQIDQVLFQARRVSELQQERQQQRDFAFARSQHFVGRAAELSRIHDYLAAPDTQPQTALFIVGPSGQGKTALLARAALGAAENAALDTVYRFVSATPASSSLPALLAQLGQELAGLYRLNWAGRSESSSQQLTGQLGALLKQLPPGRRLLICLDALDQLPDDEGVSPLDWIPDVLPEGLRLLVSALERPHDPAGQVVRRARQRFAAEAFLSLPALARVDMANMLAAELAEYRRTLQPQQQQAALDAAEQAGTPMFVRLLSEECRRWRSFDSEQGCGQALPVTLPGLIERRLAALSRDSEHGAVLVAAALGALAAARNGLDDTEMLEVLAMDTQVVQALRARSHQSLTIAPGLQARVPDIFWSRLRFDLQGYLAERQADGAVLNGFYHRSVSEVAQAHYVDAARHRRLAEYFARQPLNIDGQANRRMLSELPYQLRKAQMYLELESRLSDQDFIRALVAARGLAAYLLEAQLAFVEIRQHVDGITKGEDLAYGLLGYILRRLEQDSSWDIENIHAVLVYQQSTAFYGRFLHIAREDTGRRMAVERLGQAAADSWQAQLDLRYANLIRRNGDTTSITDVVERVEQYYRQRETLTQQDWRTLSATQYEIGYLAYLNGDFPGAVKQLQRSADSAQAAGNMHGYWLSRCALAKVRYFESPETVSEAIRINQDAERHFQAEADGDESAQRGRMNAIAHRLHMYCASRQLGAAQREYDKLARDPWIRRFGEGVMLERFAAMLLALQGRHEEAGQRYEAFLEAFPGERNPAKIEAYAQLLWECADILQRAGRCAHARKRLVQAVYLPDAPANQVWKRKALHQLGILDETCA